MISSIRSIPTPSCRAHENQWSIWLIIHLPKSVLATVFCPLACIGRDNTAPSFIGHKKETPGISSGLRKCEGQYNQNVELGYPAANRSDTGIAVTLAEQKLLGLSLPILIWFSMLRVNCSWY